MNTLALPCVLLLLTFHCFPGSSYQIAHIKSVGTPCLKGGNAPTNGRSDQNCRQHATVLSSTGSCCPSTSQDSLRAKAILVCGGVSQRMNGELSSLLHSGIPDYRLHADTPPYKQFIFMHGLPLFVYSLAEFLASPLISEITIAGKPEWNQKILEYVDAYTGTLLDRLDPKQRNRGPAQQTKREASQYESHLKSYSFFIYDLEERQCVLRDSDSWTQALDTVLKRRNTRYKIIKLCSSGDSRAQTVFNALRGKNALDARLPGCCREEYIVLVHDAVRPLARYLDIGKLIAAAAEHGAAVPAVGVTDTIKTGSKMDDLSVVESTLDRSSLFAIQTPQAFRSSVLIRAYANVMGNAEGAVPSRLTDDASFVEHLGQQKVVLVPGHKLNMKVTVWEDIRSCSRLLKEAYFTDT